MSDNPLDKISQTLGCETGLEYDEPEEIKIEDITDRMKTVLRKNNGDDYQFVRSQLKSAIESAASMLPGLVGLAKVAESPNLYNSASSFLDTFVKLNNALVDNGVKMEKAVTAGAKNDKPEVTPPALPAPAEEEAKATPGAFAFEGTTEQLLDMVLKTQKTTSTVVDVEAQFINDQPDGAGSAAT